MNGPAQPIAILCSDLHFSHNAPVARSAEPDWYVVQKRYIDELASVQKKCGMVPIVVAGDIFDRWQSHASPAELVNFLIDALPPKIYAVPGQHDLPTHNYQERHRSPYGTLIRSKAVAEILPDEPIICDSGVVLHGFPWGFDLHPLKDKQTYGSSYTHLAVVHSYIWKMGCSYPDAPREQRADCYRPGLIGYDAAVFGDNHIGFMLGESLLNCGTFLRRKSDERSYRPCIGIIFRGGRILQHFLDVSGDLWLDNTTSAVAGVQIKTNMDAVLQSLQSIDDDSLNFRTSLNRYMEVEKTSSAVRGIVESVVC